MSRAALYNKEECRKLALKYTSRWALGKEHPTAYSTIHSNGWDKELFSHMIRPVWFTWTESKLRKEAKKYLTRKDFIVGSKSAYESARKRGLLDKICRHMTAGNRKSKWIKSACEYQAKKYSSRSQFQYGSPSAYEAARVSGWLDDICTHMLDGKYVKRRRYVYRYYFPETKEVYIGITWNVRSRIRQHVQSMSALGIRIYKKVKCYRRVEGPFTTGKAVKLERLYIEKCKVNGLNVLNIRMGGSIGRAN